MISFPLLPFTKITETYGKNIHISLTAGRSYDRNPSSKMISILKRMFQTVAVFAFYQNYQTLEKLYI